MSVGEYLKSKLLYICVTVLAVVFLAGILNAHKLPVYSIFYICAVIFLGFFIPLFVEFLRKRTFYNNLRGICETLDKKYLLSEMVEEPDFFEGEMFYEILRLCNKSMNDEIARYKTSTQDYKEYIEKWVHEIKTPISACKLALENNRSELSNEISEDLDRIDSYVMQTLFYSRISNAQKDYIIKEKTLNELVANTLKSNSRTLIKSGFSIERENLDITVMTDEKWLGFILEQIISNSVKYKTQKPQLAFRGEENENMVRLYICDNGIGIDGADLSRIFEKNFTGGNGRLNHKATGYGLYLCKKLCSKLGLEISAMSENGTTIIITFPKGNGKLFKDG